MNETEIRRYRNLYIVFLGIGIILVVTLFMLLLRVQSTEKSISSLSDEVARLKENPLKTIIVEKHKIFRQLRMEEVNKQIEYLLETGYEEDVYGFFDGYSRNREITTLMLKNDLKYNVPVTLDFAMVQWESGFNPNAKNSNGKSTDYGLKQLNDKTFIPGWVKTPEELLNIPVNIEFGARHYNNLVVRYQGYDNALIAYNGGQRAIEVRILPETFRYYSGIMAIEERIRDRFVEHFGHLLIIH